MDVLTSETCRALHKEIIKQVTSSWSLFTQLPLNVFDIDNIENVKIALAKVIDTLIYQ